MKKNLILSGIAILATSLTSCEKNDVNKKGNAPVDRPKAVDAALNSTWTNYHRPTGMWDWTAGDATISIPYVESGALTKSFFFHGDSHIGGITGTTTQTRNCGFNAVNNIRRFTYTKPYTIPNTGTWESIEGNWSGPGGYAASPLKFEDGKAYWAPAPPAKTPNYRLWPHHGFQDGSNIKVIMGKYDHGMVLSKVYLGIFSHNTATTSDIVCQPINVRGDATIAWGVWTIVSGSDVYIYGTKGTNLYLAKSTKSAIGAGVWDFLTGWTTSGGVTTPVWTGGATSTVPPINIGLGVSDFSNHLSVVKFKNTSNQDKYVLIQSEKPGVSCASGAAGRKIFAYTPKDKPWGPFTSARTTIHTATDANVTVYDAQAHPEIYVGNNLLVSYNVNDSWCPPSTCNSSGTTQWPADNYRPKFVDVPFSSIDASLSSIQPTW